MRWRFKCVLAGYDKYFTILSRTEPILAVLINHAEETSNARLLADIACDFFQADHSFGLIISPSCSENVRPVNDDVSSRRVSAKPSFSSCCGSDEAHYPEILSESGNFIDYRTARCMER